MAFRTSEIKTIAKGNLVKTPFAHLLIYLDQHELSGTLALWPEVVETTEVDDADLILFRGGWPVSAVLKQQTETLEAGLLRFFTVERAGYVFYEGNLLAGRPGRLDGKRDPLAVVAQSLRGSTRDEVIDALLKRLGESKLRIQPRAEIARFKLDPKERGLVELLQAEPSDMAYLVRNTALPERRSKRLIYLLLITNAVTIYEEPPEELGAEDLEPEPETGFPAAEPSSARPANVGAHSPMSEPRPPAYEPRPPISEPRPPAYEPRQSSRAPRKQSPAQFSIAPEEVEAEIGPLFSQSPPSGAGRRDSLAPNLNISHDSRLGLVPPPPGSLPLEMKRRWVEIKKTVENIEHINYFQMLGVKKEAPPEEVRDSFFALAKKWHPDRLPQELQPLKPQVEAVFAYYSEANACLSDDEQRATYLQSVREGGGTPAAERLMQRTIEGALTFQKVEVLVRQHRTEEALELLDHIIEMTGGESDYFAMRGWLLLQRHKGADAPFETMLTCVDKALKMDNRHERAHLTKGLILKRMGRDQEALRHFKTVSEINPKNVDAMREVRIASMRKGPGGKAKSTEEGGGLFGGLFKKK